LLTCRYLQPAEAAVFGETLWQAQLWLVAAAVWCWRAARSGRPALRWSLLDAFLWLLVLGHALSTLPVFLEGGDRRAAVNIAWEWAGLATTAFLVRQVFAGAEIHRPARLFAAVTVGLAALGIWQHHVSFPETAAEYRTLREQEETPFSGNSTANRDRLAEIRRELAAFGTPIDPGGRKRWEDRLLSTEPFATFGLANTLGGLLAAAVPLVLVSRAQPPRRPAITAGLVASAGLLLYCLLLTKSRTAWVGLAAGTVVAGGLHIARGRLSRRTLVIAVAAVCGVVLLGAIGLVTGGIDLEVFGEAPKSFRYRLDYWTGALRVLADRPLLGTGAGNFRSYYLEHRPAGASEEIAAPHDLFLDVWTAGGLISLLALVGLLGYVGFRFLSAAGRRDSDETAWGPADWGFVAAFPLTMLVLLLAGQGIDVRIAAVGFVSAASLWCLTRSNAGPLVVVGTGAGFCVLAVHLLGADGIEFPAVIQTLLLLALTADVSRPTSGRLASGIASATGFGFLAAGCLLTGTAPVLNAGALTARAETLIERGDPSADRVLAEAEAADPLGTRPPLLRAELATSRALGSGSDSDFATARRRWEDVLTDQPRDIQTRRRLAELLTARGERTSDAADFEAAARRLVEAVSLSPTDVTLRVDLARAWAAAGQADAAREPAREALKLDQLNREAGHADLVFSPETLAEMRRLARVGNAPPEP
jgi:O-antigen ligase